MSKYFETSNLNEISQSIDKIILIRKEMLTKYGIDVLENDTVSLSKFVNKIKAVDPNYNCNFSRNGEDSKTIIDGKTIFIENKTSKVQKNKKGSYPKANFAFHAEGIINHDAYLFNVWDKYTLNPIVSYYVKDIDNVKKINNELSLLSNQWKQKPKTKAGYDVIHIKETMLIDMIKTTSVFDDYRVHLL